MKHLITVLLLTSFMSFGQDTIPKNEWTQWFERGFYTSKQEDKKPYYKYKLRRFNVKTSTFGHQRKRNRLKSNYVYLRKKDRDYFKGKQNN